MRIAVVLLLLHALAAIAAGQEAGVVRVSAFTDREITLPAPIVPPAQHRVMCGHALYGVPAPARTAVYRYALVDAEGRLGPWSEPTTIRQPAGGAVRFNLCRFIPDDHEICGVCWREGDELALVHDNGPGPDQLGLPPWSSVRPDWLYDLRNVRRAPPPAGTSLVLTTRPPRPLLEAFTLPNEDLEGAFCWIDGQGRETALSPICPAPGRPDYPASGVGFRTFSIAWAVPPSGAAGYRLYLRRPGGPWRRGGEYSLDVMQPVVHAWPGPVHQPDQARSIVTALQLALDARQSDDVVLVDVPVTRTTVPVIDRWGPERSILAGPHGRGWRVEYSGSGAVALLVQSSYTTYRGMHLVGGCRAVSNFSGGQAFGCRYEACKFAAGIRCLDASARWQGDHTESETAFDGCYFIGDHDKDLAPIHLEGQQTASVRFRNTHVYGDHQRRRGSCCLRLAVPRAQVVFEGGLFADFGHTFALLGPMADVRIDYVFVDQGHGTVADGFAYAAGRLRLRDGKLNAPDLTGGRTPYLAKGLAQVRLEAVDVQDNHQPAGTFRWRADATANFVLAP